MTTPERGHKATLPLTTGNRPLVHPAPEHPMTDLAASASANVRSGLRLRKFRDRIVETGLLAAALVAVFTTVAIVVVLVSESLPFFNHVSVVDFLTDTMWTPLFAEARYGILPLVAGTLVTTLV